ncbi:MAG: VOC family protein [Gammaproteobacteria bacterium]|nr:VOC family protein [Gammaproteobacteria bacterium]
MNIDHVVLWVQNPKNSLDFFVDVVGLCAVRAQEFEEGKAPFPSVRLNDMTILDLMDTKLVSLGPEFIGGDSAGRPINHLCLSMNAAEYSALTARLVARGVELTPESERSFGAQGLAERSKYFRDPDGNVIEIRHYDKAS